MFIVSATVLPNSRDIYSICVGAIMKTSLVMSAGFSFLIGCCMMCNSPYSLGFIMYDLLLMRLSYHIFLVLALVKFYELHYIIKYLDQMAENCYISS